MKQKIITAIVVVILIVIGLPIGELFTNTPASTVDSMFTRVMLQGAAEKISGKESEKPAFSSLCISEEVAEQIWIGMGLALMPILDEDGWDYDIVGTKKNGDSAVVSVKLNSGSKSVVVDFQLKKVKVSGGLDGYLKKFSGNWILTGVEKSK